MKGVWRSNDKKVGEDFGCINIPGTKALSVTVSSFGISGGVDEATLKAEEDFASIGVDPKPSPSSSVKGSSPVRTDVPTDKLDACNTLVVNSLKKEGFSVQDPFYGRTSTGKLGVEHDVHVPGRPVDDRRPSDRDAEERIRRDLLR